MQRRALLAQKQRWLIKAGTTVVTKSSGGVALGRIGHLVEQIKFLKQLGKEVILVSSGSIACGRQKLTADLDEREIQRIKDTGSRSFAAAGQSRLMALYEQLFELCNLTCCQVLVTDEDFLDPERKSNLLNTLEQLLEFGAVPILNENDVISTRKTPLRDEKGKVFWDNDSLSTLIATGLHVDAMVLLTDVNGLYTLPPKEGRIPEVVYEINVLSEEEEKRQKVKSNFIIGEKSQLGRGGMDAKLEAARSAVRLGVSSVLIASGFKYDVVRRIVEGQLEGTLLYTGPPLNRSNMIIGEETLIELCGRGRDASRILANLTTEERSKILLEMANALEESQAELILANKRDLEEAERVDLKPALKDRLSLDSKKIATLALGIRQLATLQDPVGNVLEKRLVSQDLVLTKISTPLGVVCVIFESRPDVLPQVASLAIKTGNCLILKGGKEAAHTNKAFTAVLQRAIERGSGKKVSGDILVFLTSRDEVKNVLSLHQHIDLIIPRGSGELVNHIQSNTKIPVLGHSEGICHVYVDSEAKPEVAYRIILESKIDYPSACNAVETLLLHKDFIQNEVLVQKLREAGIDLRGCPESMKKFKLTHETDSFREEYGDQRLSVKIVNSFDEAIVHINKYGSHHTDAIVTTRDENAQRFMKEVDSACTFVNSSTRFADGFRFGLGAEVGISTSKIHARGPVGVEGLLSSKWLLVSNHPQGHLIGDCEPRKGGGRNEGYLHKNIPDAKL